MTLNSEWKKIKKKLCVSVQERDRIATETKRQSSCTEWFTHRRVRITASKCKTATLKPSTSPSKAMSEILNCNKQFQSHQMKQGLRDDKGIIKNMSKQSGMSSETTYLFSRHFSFNRNTETMYIKLPEQW